MKSYKELRDLIDLKLNKIEYLDETKSLYSPVEYILSLKAKRIRPVLLMMSHQLSENNYDRIQSVVSSFYGISIEEMVGKKRHSK